MTVNGLEFIGLIACIHIGFKLVRGTPRVLYELYRAAKQTNRYLRAGYGRDRKPVGPRIWLGLWVDELGARYTTIEVGMVILPHDVSKPVRRRRWW